MEKILVFCDDDCSTDLARCVRRLLGCVGDEIMYVRLEDTVRIIESADWNQVGTIIVASQQEPPIPGIKLTDRVRTFYDALPAGGDYWSIKARHTLTAGSRNVRLRAAHHMAACI